MRDNRCPTCENDISDAVNAAVVRAVTSGSEGVDSLRCPHCDAALSVTINLSTTLSLQRAAGAE